MGFFGKKAILGLVPILGLVLWFGLFTPGRNDASETLESEPKRVLRAVSLGPNITETIFALGQGHCLVGVSDFDNYPAEVRELPRVGGYLTPNLERLLALRPDLVLLHGKHEKMDTFCRNKGIQVVHVAMDSLASVHSAITQLGEVFQCPERAAGLSSTIRNDLEALGRTVSPYQRPRVFVCLWRSAGGLSGLGTVGKGSYVGELLEVAGGDSIFKDVAIPYPEASKESLMKGKPEVILELRPGEEISDEQKRALISDWQVLRTVPAVQSGRIHILTDDFLLVPGPRMGLAARAIARALHPEMDHEL
jgi:iron complex transport system substrate-binding protein